MKKIIEWLKAKLNIRSVRRSRSLDREIYIAKLDKYRFGAGSVMYEMRIYWWIELYFIIISYGRDCVESDFA